MLKILNSSVHPLVSVVDIHFSFLILVEYLLFDCCWSRRGAMCVFYTFSLFFSTNNLAFDPAGSRRIGRGIAGGLSARVESRLERRPRPQTGELVFLSVFGIKYWYISATDMYAL